jgi:hypothetical protein
MDRPSSRDDQEKTIENFRHIGSPKKFEIARVPAPSDIMQCPYSYVAIEPYSSLLTRGVALVRLIGIRDASQSRGSNSP